jgi:copper(I)-binding protein
MTNSLLYRLSDRLRRVLVVGSLLVVLGLVAGCDTTSATGLYVPDGGVDARHGSMMLEDVWIDAPHGAHAGADSGLRMYVDNGSDHSEAIVKVSTPLARSVRLLRDGHPVGRLRVRAEQAQDMEWHKGNDGVELVHLKHAVEPGQWYPVTVTFAHSPAITMQVTIAPLTAAHGN